MPQITADDVVDFWRAAGPSCWFASSDAFDARCRERFLDVHLGASMRRCDDWMDSAQGTLGLLLVLDQMPRNIYRGSAHAYATDPLARHVASQALARGDDKAIDADLRPFMYLPFMHSEDIGDQRRSLELHAALGDNQDKWARHHHGIIQRFGRFPHRNAVLGRTSTPEEEFFLGAGGFGA
ncbi:MAG: DUF924 family protein [Pseudomonadota bacterium]|nr:DUF924 family protein [Pseudomonadota bacterium]